MLEMLCSWQVRRAAVVGAILLGLWVAAPVAQEAGAAAAQATPAQAPRHAGGEANLVLPNLGAVDFHGVNGRTLLMAGLVVCVFGLAFGMVIFTRLRNLPVHK